MRIVIRFVFGELENYAIGASKPRVNGDRGRMYPWEKIKGLTTRFASYTPSHIDITR